MAGLFDWIERFIDSLFGKADKLSDYLEKKYDSLDSKLESKFQDLESKGDDLEKRAEAKINSLFGKFEQKLTKATSKFDKDDDDFEDQDYETEEIDEDDDISEANIGKNNGQARVTHSQNNPRPEADVETNVKSKLEENKTSGDRVKFEGNKWSISMALNGYNHFYLSYNVTGDPKLAGKYLKLDRGASKIIKEMAKNLGIEASASAQSSKLAELILKQVLGDKYRNPTRGVSETICNHAIINGYLLEYVYENDGIGRSDSIKKNAYIYVKQTSNN